MDNAKMFCPLIKSKCLEKECAWFLIGPKVCAVNLIAQCEDAREDTLYDIRDAVDRIE